MGRRREFDEAVVVEQAMELFWLQGYKATSPQNLVDATGLSKSSLYATFNSKQGLFLAALERYVQTQVDVMIQMLATGTLRENLQALYGALIHMAASSEQARTCLVCSSALQTPVDGSESEVAALVLQGHERIEDVFYERLVRAQASGELAADRDPRTVARFLLNNNMGLMVLARTRPDPAVLEPMAAEIIRAVC